MSGRGCTILIKLLGGSSGQGETEDMSLPVALHSPLQVLKDQLHQLVSIAPRDQVLILCDFSDPERNSDRVLPTGLNSLSLRECGIRNGSTLTLHALGMSAERKQQMMREAFATKSADLDASRPTYTLETPISAADANHSYNGIIFDIECKGPYEIEIYAVSLAGMLARVRVFGRDRPWEADKPAEPQTQHYWAHHDRLSRIGWDCVADKVCRPSWDKPIEIRFTKPLLIGPHQRKALYCHSGLPDDLGIQYQSFQKHDVVAEDEYMRLLPGLGHTGSQPFDEVHGWYRSYRGLAGSVQYHMRWKGWSPLRHMEFPITLRTAVRTMLLCNLDSAAARSMAILFGAQQNTAAPSTLFITNEQREHQENIKKADANNQIVRSNTNSGATAAEAAMMTTSETPRRPRFTLSSLPVYIIYNILEFMHFDWFSPQEEEQYSRAQPSLAQSTLQSLQRRIRQAFHSGSVGAVAANIHQIAGELGVEMPELMQMIYSGFGGFSNSDDDEEEEEEEFEDYDDDEDDDGDEDDYEDDALMAEDEEEGDEDDEDDEEEDDDEDEVMEEEDEGEDDDGIVEAVDDEEMHDDNDDDNDNDDDDDFFDAHSGHEDDYTD